MKTPKFKNINEERKFWETHDSTDYLDDFEVTKQPLRSVPRFGSESFEITFSPSGEGTRLALVSIANNDSD